jgi:hypothetical protein
MTVIRGPAHAERAVVAADTIFWGCAEKNIRKAGKKGVIWA